MKHAHRHSWTRWTHPKESTTGASNTIRRSEEPATQHWPAQKLSHEPDMCAIFTYIWGDFRGSCWHIFQSHASCLGCLYLLVVSEGPLSVVQLHEGRKECSRESRTGQSPSGTSHETPLFFRCFLMHRRTLSKAKQRPYTKCAQHQCAASRGVNLIRWKCGKRIALISFETGPPLTLHAGYICTQTQKTASPAKVAYT